jgi:transposase
MKRYSVPPYHRTKLPGALSVPARAYEAEKMVRDGKTAREVAKHFDVSEAAVRNWLEAVREERRTSA